MSTRKDPRRRSFFDTPSSHGTADDDQNEESAVPRRQKRTRRVSAGAGTVFTTDDGFQYRRRQTLINPKALTDVDTSPKNSSKSANNQSTNPFANSKTKEKSPRSLPLNENEPERNGQQESNAAFAKRLSDSTKFQKIPKKVDDGCISGSSEYPTYPDTSEWTPTMPDNNENSVEVNLLNFLKELVSFEICQASCVYLKDEHKFIIDRIESVGKAFLAKANETVLKILDEKGPLKKPKILPNPANDALREKQKMWNDVIATTRAELAAWDELKNRPLCPDATLEEPVCKVEDYLQEQNLQHLLEPVEYHEPILKGFLSISVKADNIYKAAQASSQVLTEAMSIQDRITRWVTQRSLKPVQKTIDPQAALLNVINSRAI